MYLKRAIITNSGPLRHVDVELGFGDQGAPKPLILVGSNGGGKTNFLSLITDAIFEAAAAHYNNVLPTKGMGRSWFRLVGGRTTTVGTPGGFSLLKFENNNETIMYREKAGIYSPETARSEVPPDFSGFINWNNDGAFKSIDISEGVAKQIFDTGVYAYFPSSRSEIPYWLNRESIPETEVDIFSNISSTLRKPIYIERGLHKFKQWLISVILESRSHVIKILHPTPQLLVTGDVEAATQSAKALELCNIILRLILDDDGVRFVWLGRKSPEKLAIARGDDIILPNLDALSGGQSILLALFGTLLLYADQSMEGSALDLSKIEGICVVDEIDAHIHVDLQHKSLPELIKLFPRIQFILSSHSPLFVIGMQKKFGGDKFQLVEMPMGNIVTAEGYSEFEKAMGALVATEAFNEKLLSESSKSAKPLIFTEGETDAPYLRRAAELLGRGDILDRCEIQWVGAKDESGQGFHTGKGALDHTLAVLRANPKLTNRKIMLLYDNDTNKVSADYGLISVRRMPTNQHNQKVQAGIENLLDNDSINDSDYQVIDTRKPNGDMNTRKTLRKAELCHRLCQNGTVNDFQNFSSALDLIQEYLGETTLDISEFSGTA